MSWRMRWKELANALERAGAALRDAPSDWRLREELLHRMHLRQLSERVWLYVVTFCRGTGFQPANTETAKMSAPRLHIIQAPISRLNPETLYRQVQYLVQEGDWSAQGEEVGGVAMPGGQGGAS